MAAELSKHETQGSEPGDRSAARWNTHLRFALTTGLRFSGHSNDNTTTLEGDISNELRMGTFLTSLDTSPTNKLTAHLARSKLCKHEITVPFRL